MVFFATDIHAVRDRIVELGGEIVCEPQLLAVHTLRQLEMTCRDPDGMMINIIERPTENWDADVVQLGARAFPLWGWRASFVGSGYRDGMSAGSLLRVAVGPRFATPLLDYLAPREGPVPPAGVRVSVAAGQGKANRDCA